MIARQRRSRSAAATGLPHGFGPLHAHPPGPGGRSRSRAVDRGTGRPSSACTPTIQWDAVVIDESHSLVNQGSQRRALAETLAPGRDQPAHQRVVRTRTKSRRFVPLFCAFSPHPGQPRPQRPKGLVPRPSVDAWKQTDRHRHEREPQRARSLLFVAATRARDALTISRNGEPSRFLRPPGVRRTLK
jgi:hypothetical protein